MRLRVKTTKLKKKNSQNSKNSIIKIETISVISIKKELALNKNDSIDKLNPY